MCVSVCVRACACVCANGGIMYVNWCAYWLVETGRGADTFGLSNEGQFRVAHIKERVIREISPP